MKKWILAAMIVMLSGSLSYAAPNKSFKIGMPYSTAQILLEDKMIGGKTITPTLALSYFSIGSSFKRTENGSTDESSMSAHFLIPRLGARVQAEKTRDLKSYYYGEAFMVIPFINGDDISDDNKDEIRDATDLLGLTVGSGVEYYFSDSFSVGGELSFNMVFHSMTNEYTDSYDDYSYKSEFNSRIGATLTQITFNYYFQ